MRIYTACCTKAWRRVRAFNDDARAAGHIITVDWTLGVEALNGASEATIEPAEAWAYARDDLEGGVGSAACVVFLADEGNYCGALIEYGYALAVVVPILLVAPWRPSIFWHSPSTTILPDENAAREALGMRALRVAA
jgi:hypothetical protein